ncbi:hypothetical protein [Paenibacillus sp. Leaf72]|uniref:hypothetical protein n=1 Tax=Paenibacillus sp. Leaf72 TaxID=1736234 RepID=UPI0006F9C66B|nr:hypothetical protein [Paenibacillus sp. Leaf72]KQN97009.1 hypothetical protein ASF12_23355 [Paenibacillus sp. Leaf72]
MISMIVIVDKYNEGFFWDNETKDFTLKFSEKCLFPTKDMAQTLIDEELGTDAVVANIMIYQYTLNGIWDYTVQNVWEEGEIDPKFEED